MWHYIEYGFIGYLLVGMLICEIALFYDRKRGRRPTLNQYLNLVFMWPIVLYVARKMRRQNKK